MVSKMSTSDDESTDSKGIVFKVGHAKKIDEENNGPGPLKKADKKSSLVHPPSTMDELELGKAGMTISRATENMSLQHPDGVRDKDANSGMSFNDEHEPLPLPHLEQYYDPKRKDHMEPLLDT